jgi:SAM-dependent methyltransferase
MTVDTAHAMVAELLTSFTTATPDAQDRQYRRLVDALWDQGDTTSLAATAVPAIIASLSLDKVDERRAGSLAILLGVLAEVEFPETDGELYVAVRAGVRTYVDLIARATGTPLVLALLYLLQHFPGDRDIITTTVADLDLADDDRTRLDRALSALDLERPDLGRVWPAPSVWALESDEESHDRSWIDALSPAQTMHNWDNDTRTIYGFAGAKAYWAVRNGAAPSVMDAAPVDLGALDRPLPDLPGTAFSRHDSLRCPTCHGSLSYSDLAARCASCATTYQIEGGILDLSAGVRDGVLPDDDTADLLQRLSELPSMGLYYEARMRPAYLSLSGTNWGGVVTPSDEDAYIANQLRDSEGTVLDLAAGAGRWTGVVAETVGVDRLVALDMGLPMLTVLRRRLPDVPAVRATALNLPFGDATLGAINCWNALQAFPEDAAEAIAEMGRVLRPGGKLTMMTFRWDTDPIARYFQACQFFPSRPAGHLLFDLEQLRRWLANAGLGLTDLSGPSTFVFITAERQG